MYFFYVKPALLISAIVALLALLIHLQTVELREVQSGSSELWCHLHTGWQKIEPDNVDGLHSNGKWLFTDGGSARSCEVVRND